MNTNGQNPDQVKVELNGKVVFEGSVPRDAQGNVSLNFLQEELEIVAEFNGLKTKTRTQRGERR